MKNDCAKWKDELLEAALTGTIEGALRQHLEDCTKCAAELAALRIRRERLDALLPQVALAGELSPDFRARVLAEMGKTGSVTRRTAWQLWGLAGAVGLAAVLIAFLLHRNAVRPVPGAELAAAEKLAEWRAPSDVLLKTPGQEILRTTPKLGESYLHIPAKKTEEE